VKKLRDAFKNEFLQMRAATGGTIDPQLALYNRLTQEQFARIAERYGLEKTAEYVREMEQRLAREEQQR